MGNTGRQRAPLSAIDSSGTGERTPTAASIGRPFGRYVLLEDLGRGGMAVVSRALIAGPRGFARTVVIKRILAEFSREQSFVNGLATEARISAMLRHPNIVQVHEFGCVDDEYFLAMEHVDGVDLLQLMKTCAQRQIRLPVGAACHIVAEVARALAYAHALPDADGRPLEIVHRDVSPSNVMLTDLGEVKLLDFGIAKAAAHVRDEHTMTGTLKGKISYLSPEQVEGMPVDSRTDVFALGIVFHECLTQHRLFRGQSDFETMRQITQAQVTPPSAVAPGVPRELDRIVLKMLAREPADRYQTCDEMLADMAPITRRIHGDAALMREFMHQLGPLKPPLSPVPSSMPTVVPTHPPARMTLASLRRRRRRRAAFAGAGVAAGLLLVTLLLTTRHHERPAPSPPPVALPAAADPKPTVAVRELVPTPVDRVRLSLTGPIGAEATLDGKLIGTLPIEVQLPRVPGVRRLMVRAPGAKPWIRVVAADVDVALKVAPTRLRPAEPSPSSSPKPSRRSPTSVIKDPFAQ